MIDRVVEFCVAAFAVGGVGMAISNVRADTTVARRRWIKFGTYVVIVTSFLLFAFLSHTVITVAVSGIAIVGAGELLRAASNQVNQTFWRISLLAYCLLALGAVGLAWSATGETLAFVFLVVAAFDGFSQVTGQIAGRTRLVPRVSPGKTLEGALGGVMLATATAVLLRGLTGFRFSGAVFAALALSACALTGDIAASWIKRVAGIKDFGAILPGHGGVLDRFDSFMVAAPAWFLWMRL